MIKAAILEAPNTPLVVKEIPEPELETGAVMLDTIYSEVCGTDVHLLHGRLAGVPYPIIPGHISVGRVSAMNGPVCDVEGNPLVPGDVVTFLDVHETCHNCWYCLVAKTSTRCPSRKVYGITYGISDGVLGGWSEKIYLKPGVKIVKLPPDLPPEVFIGGGCGLPTAYHAVEQAAIKLGDTVVIQGSGPVGLSSLILAQLAGATTVIMVGGPDHRLTLATAMGADMCLNIETTSQQDRIAAIKTLTSGRGADVVIEATGSPLAVPEGMALARDAGTYVIAGQYTDNGDVTINPHWAINRKHLTIKGTWGIDLSHFYRSLQVMAKHHTRFPWGQIVSAQYSLHEVNQALDDVASCRIMKAVIAPYK